MRIAFIETSGLTNEMLRAVAGAAPNCVGYPDGVPESWRDGAASVASQWESDSGPIDMGVLTVSVSAVKQVPEMPGKHPICETRGKWPRLPSGKPTHQKNCRWWDGPRPGEVFRPCSCGFLLGGAGNGTLTPEQFDAAKSALRVRPDSPLWAVGGFGIVREDDLDPAVLLGPVVEPVEWPDECGDDEC